jgi:hypothetical protein
MPVIYLNERRRLTEEQKQMATVLAANEINNIMADLEILEEELDKTYLFQRLTLRDHALKYLRKYPTTHDGKSFSDEVLEEIFKYYFSENAKGNL